MRIAIQSAATVVIALSFLGMRAQGGDAPATTEHAFVPYKIDWDKGMLSAFDRDGKSRWQIAVEKLELGEPQSIGQTLAFDSDHVYVRCENGLAALDVKTGGVAWSVKEKCEVFTCIEGFLLVGEGEFSKEKPRLVVRTARDGKEISRTELPSDAMFWDISSCYNFGGLITLQLSFDDKAIILNKAGKVLHIFKEHLLQNKMVGENRVFLSGGEVISISPKDAVLWSLKIGPMGGSGGDWVELSDKTCVAYNYGSIYDSGVSLLRFDPATGNKIWSAYCKPLGVSHSKYHHEATFSVKDQSLTVHSVGSYGEFTEVLDLATGKQLSRK